MSTRALNTSNDIYVGNFPPTTTEAHLRTLFADFGTITKVRIATDMATGGSKGFGFVEFGEARDALMAIKEMNQLEVGGRTLKVNFAQNSHLESLAQRLGMDLTPKNKSNKPAYNSRPPDQRRRENREQIPDEYNSAETVSHAISELSKPEMYQILQKFKEVADKDQNAARTLLISHPQLPEAVLHMMSKLEMIKNALPHTLNVAPSAEHSSSNAAPVAQQPQFTATPPQFNAPPPQFAPPPTMGMPPPPQFQPPPSFQQPPQFNQPPPQFNQPPPGGPPPAVNTPAGLDPALIQQVMALTDQDIAGLPEGKRKSILMLKDQILRA